VSFWVCLITVLGLALGPSQHEVFVAGGDKAHHIAAFTVLAALASFGWPRLQYPICIGLLILGGGIEFCQGTDFIGRDASFLDWLADVIGVLLGMLSAAATLSLANLSRFNRSGS
jgi:VanZ family protein